jgi:hypothetical protein
MKMCKLAIGILLAVTWTFSAQAQDGWRLVRTNDAVGLVAIDAILEGASSEPRDEVEFRRATLMVACVGGWTQVTLAVEGRLLPGNQEWVVSRVSMNNNTIYHHWWKIVDGILGMWDNTGILFGKSLIDNKGPISIVVVRQNLSSINVVFPNTAGAAKAIGAVSHECRWQ